ncbi:MAG: hypothetical protein OSA93_10555 [Akkermansiaceae bacterium]|nr:hypothetical protein [Akkermansiaceae bacterium]
MKIQPLTLYKGDDVFSPTSTATFNSLPPSETPKLFFYIEQIGVID